MTETVTPVPPLAVTDPIALVALNPVSVRLESPETTTDPTAPVPAIPVTVTFDVPVTVTLPNAPVPATPVTATATFVLPQVSEPHVPLPHPLTGILRYANNRIARICCGKRN